MLAILVYRYGGERYEQRDMQIRVRHRFAELQKMDEEAGKSWNVVNAAQSMDQVETDIWNVVQETIIDTVIIAKQNKPLQKMWEEGTIDLLPVEGRVGSDDDDDKERKGDKEEEGEENHQDANKENKSK